MGLFENLETLKLGFRNKTERKINFFSLKKAKQPNATLSEGGNYKALVSEKAEIFGSTGL